MRRYIEAVEIITSTYMFLEEVAVSWFGLLNFLILDEGLHQLRLNGFLDCVLEHGGPSLPHDGHLLPFYFFLVDLLGLFSTYIFHHHCVLVDWPFHQLDEWRLLGFLPQTLAFEQFLVFLV